MARSPLTLAVLLICAACTAASAGIVIDPEPAPEWRVSEWLNGNPGKLSDHRGRIVIIEFFQLWCPGCNSFSLPLMQRWEQLYGDRDEVLLVSIHTVFEGHDFQTPERLRSHVQQKNFRRLVGIDAYEEQDDITSITMDRCDTGGTPHLAIIDKEGELRFSHFGSFDYEPVEAFINRLLREKSTHRVRSKPKVQPIN